MLADGLVARLHRSEDVRRGGMRHLHVLFLQWLLKLQLKQALDGALEFLHQSIIIGHLIGRYSLIIKKIHRETHS